MPSKQPSRAKGRRYPVEISCVAWIDLLGYGAMLRDVGFDPSHERAALAVDRLKAFQRTVTSFAELGFPAMPINDGAAFFRDLSPREHRVTYQFLERAIAVHSQVNDLERQQAHPGARMMVAAGPRMRISGVARDAPGHKSSILHRMREGIIAAEQAVHEAFSSGPVAGFVPPLQANFGFTKAYLANEAGSKAGMSGARCYVDLLLFNEVLPDWIRFSRTQSWSTGGMSAKFGEFQSLDRNMAQRSSFEGILDSIGVAQRLSIDY